MSWSVLRSESLQVYTKLLTVMKQKCEAKMAELKHKDSDFEPSALLVDNSNAEITAGRCELPCLLNHCSARLIIILHVQSSRAQRSHSRALTRNRSSA